MTGRPATSSVPTPARDWFSGSVIPPARKLPGIHGLRAVAALMIVFFHTCWIAKLDLPDWLWIVANRFGLGVHLFFLLSAFSLAHSAAITGESLRAYCIKRFFRIAPLFYAMLVFYQVWFGHKPVGENILSLLFAFNLVPGLSQGIVWASWTIGVEMVFYAVLPALLALAPTRLSAAALAAGAVAVSVAGRMVLETAAGLPATFAHEAFVSNLGVFCLGLFAYRIYADTPDRPRVALASAIAFLAAAVVLLGPLLAVVLPGRSDLLLWVAAFGLATVWQAARPSWLMCSGFMQFVGERSYSVYLLHPFVIFSMQKQYAQIYRAVDAPGISFLLCAFLTTVVVLALADVTYRLIEVPGIRLGRRINQATGGTGEKGPAPRERGADAAAISTGVQDHPPAGNRTGPQC